MSEEPPRCTNCGETREPMIERVSRPLWSNTKAELWFCNCCGKTFCLAKLTA